MGRRTIPLTEIPARMLSINDAAELIGMSPSAVRDAIRDGELAAYRFRNRIRIPEAALLAALKPVQSVEVEG